MYPGFKNIIIPVIEDDQVLVTNLLSTINLKIMLNKKINDNLAA